MVGAVAGHLEGGRLLGLPFRLTAALPATRTTGEPLALLGIWGEIAYFGRRGISAKVVRETAAAYSDELETITTNRYAFALPNREQLGLSVLNLP